MMSRPLLPATPAKLSHSPPDTQRAPLQRESPAQRQSSFQNGSLNPTQAKWGLYHESVFILPHEPLESYTLGGLHPVTLGDTLQGGRYTIRHKLGYGGQSTVWLAWDLQGTSWVSIKIKAASASAADLSQDPEINVLRKLEEHYCDANQTKPRCFVQLLDSFQHTGPNGTHNCIVTELLGPSLSEVLSCYQTVGETLRPDTVLRTSRQLLEGLELAHESGIAHGDVSPGNVVFTCNNAQDDDDHLFETMGGKPVVSSYTSDTPRPSSLPKQLIKSVTWDLWYDDEEEDIRLIDWGWSYAVDKTINVLGQPMHLRPPETFFLHSFNYKHDLWRAGSVIYSLFYQKPPFSYFCDKDHFFIRRLVSKLGPLPPPWQNKWEEMLKDNKYAEEDEKAVPAELIQDTFEPRLREIIRIWHAMSSDRHEKDEFLAGDLEALGFLLQPILRLMEHEPEKRISLQEAASYIKWPDYRREANKEE